MKMNKSHSVTLKQDQGFFFFFFQIITTHLMIADTFTHLFVTYYLIISLLLFIYLLEIRSTT
jgi:hypothetical protein